MCVVCEELLHVSIAKKNKQIYQIHIDNNKNNIRNTKNEGKIKGYIYCTHVKDRKNIYVIKENKI
jgi:hypothetical protein